MIFPRSHNGHFVQVCYYFLNGYFSDCMKFLLLLTLLLLPIGGLLAQQPGFTLNRLSFSEGEFLQENLHYNAVTDVLTVSNGFGDSTYTAAAVQYFSWQQEEYYSLPFLGDFAFFKVIHEDTRFAVVHKQANAQLLRYFVAESRGTLQICEEEGGSMRLCEKQIGPSFGMPVYAGGSTSYLLDNALFVLMNGQLHLVDVTYNTSGELFASVPGLKKKNRRILKQLRQIIDDDRQMQQLRKFVAASRVDLQDPQQLVVALKTLYP